MKKDYIQLVIFWLGKQYDESKPDKYFTDRINNSNALNIIPGFSGEKYIDNEFLLHKESFFLKDTDARVPFSLVSYLNRYESQIYRVIERNLITKGESATFRSVEKVYIKLLKNLMPLIQSKNSVFIFFDIPHHPIDYIAFLICDWLKNSRVVTRGFSQVHNERILTKRYITSSFPFMDDTYYQDITNNLELTGYELSVESKAFEEEYFTLKSADATYSTKHLGSRISSLSHLQRMIKGLYSTIFLRRIWSPKYYYSRILANLKRLFLHSLITRSFRFYYEKIISKNILSIESSFIYYPLHIQPEASTNPLGGTYHNQLFVIEQLLAVLPSDILLVIREHPAYWHRKNTNEDIRLSRSFRFYRKLRDNDKVLFVSTSENHRWLIENSIATVSISGTVIWESFAIGKPSIVFGNYIHSKLPNVISLELLNSVMLNDLIKDYSLDVNSARKRFVNALRVLDRFTTPMLSDSLKSLDTVNRYSKEFDFIIDYINTNIIRN